MTAHLARSTSWRGVWPASDRLPASVRWLPGESARRVGVRPQLPIGAAGKRPSIKGSAFASGRQQEGAGSKTNHRVTINPPGLLQQPRQVKWGGDLKRTEYLERNRLRRTGNVFETYITEGDGLRRALLDREPVYNGSGNNADRQVHQFRKLTREFLEKCP